jgi:putative PIN family toxin of toxin-antitoxin system
VRLVLDTNVVVSALLWGGMPFRLIESATAGDVELVTSPALLEELRGVLRRPRFIARLAQQQASVERAIALYAELAVNVSPVDTPRVVPADAADYQVVAAAVAGGAAFIVSGDRHLLELGAIRIATPAQLVGLLDAVSETPTQGRSGD